MIPPHPKALQGLQSLFRLSTQFQKELAGCLTSWRLIARSRSALLAQTFLFGLRDYAELYIVTSRLRGESVPLQESVHP